MVRPHAGQQNHMLNSLSGPQQTEPSANIYCEDHTKITFQLFMNKTPIQIPSQKNKKYELYNNGLDP